MTFNTAPWPLWWCYRQFMCFILNRTQHELFTNSLLKGMGVLFTQQTQHPFDSLEIIQNPLFHVLKAGIIMIKQEVILQHLWPPTAVLSVSSSCPQTVTFMWQRRNSLDSFICSGTTGAGWKRVGRSSQMLLRVHSGNIWSSDTENRTHTHTLH